MALYKNFIICFSFFFIYGCQLNNSLTKLMDNVQSRSDLKNKNESTKKIEESQIVKKIIKKKKNLENDKSKIISKPKIFEDLFEAEDNELTLIQPKIIYPDIKKIVKIGLLLPVSGKDFKIGEKLINSVRVYLNNKVSNLDFFVLDTKSSKDGLIDAFNNGLKQDIKVYVGPIFSYETNILKNYSRNKDVKIFSLSTDRSIVSDKIIMSGFSVEDEIDCLFNDFNLEKMKHLGIIINDSDYGDLLKKIIKKKMSLDPMTKLTFLRIEKNKNIENEIKEFSFFDDGVQLLNQEILRVEGLQIKEIEKNKILKNLKNQVTFGEKKYDSIIIGEGGNRLIEILSLLSFYDINSSNTLIYGTSMWEGIEKYKEEVLNKTFYVSSLKENDDSFSDQLGQLFDSKPISLDYLIYDLLGLIENSNFSNIRLASSEEKIFDGNFMNSSLSLDGTFRREIFLYKYILNKKKLIKICSIL